MNNTFLLLIIKYNILFIFIKIKTFISIIIRNILNKKLVYNKSVFRWLITTFVLFYDIILVFSFYHLDLSTYQHVRPVRKSNGMRERSSDQSQTIQRSRMSFLKYLIWGLWHVSYTQKSMPIRKYFQSVRQWLTPSGKRQRFVLTRFWAIGQKETLRHKNWIQQLNLCSGRPGHSHRPGQHYWSVWSVGKWCKNIKKKYDEKCLMKFLRHNCIPKNLYLIKNSKFNQINMRLFLIINPQKLSQN